MLRHMMAGTLTAAEASCRPTWQRVGLRVAGPAIDRLCTAGRIRWLSRLWMPLGERVVVVGADLAAVELAEFLAERRRRVVLLDERPKIAPEVGRKRRAEQMDRLDTLGVVVNTGVSCEQITPLGVCIRSDDGDRRLVEADSVILAGQVVADTALFDALEGLVSQAHAIGDCTGLGLIRKATEDARRVACAI